MNFCVLREMGNESSMNANVYSRAQVEMYQQNYKKMEETITVNNNVIQMLTQEKQLLMTTIEDLKNQLAKKDEEIKRRLAEARNNKKSVDSELNKYKSMSEFEEILNLNKELVNFQSKITTAIESNCDMLQMNKHDDEIERIKRHNAELYGKLKNSAVRCVIAEKSVELKEAENELNTKKENARQEFVKVNGKLVQIKEKMKQATTKFAGTIEKSIEELKKNLQTYKKEFAAIEQANLKINDSLMYEKVKNILLQQENTLMKEMIASNAGSSTNYTPNPPLQKKIHNSFSSQNFKNIETPETNIPYTVFNKNSGGSKDNLVNFEVSDDDNGNSDTESTFSIVDDDESETGSVSGRQKTYKLILLNVHEEGHKSDEQKVQMVLSELTKLSLNDIDVRRIGKPTGKARPIVVAFESYNYIQELLRNRQQLRNTKFNAIRVCPYKSKPNQNDPNKKPWNPKNPNKPNTRKFNKGGKGQKDFNMPF